MKILKPWPAGDWTQWYRPGDGAEARDGGAEVGDETALATRQKSTDYARKSPKIGQTRVHFVPAGSVERRRSPDAGEADPRAVRTVTSDQQRRIQHVSSIRIFRTTNGTVAINCRAPSHTSKIALADMQNGVGAASSTWRLRTGSRPGMSCVQARHHWLTKSHCAGKRETQITYGAICPGWVDTPLVRKQIEARAAAGRILTMQRGNSWSAKQPNERFVAEHLAELALFLTTRKPAAPSPVAPNDGWWLDGAVNPAAPRGAGGDRADEPAGSRHQRPCLGVGFPRLAPSTAARRAWQAGTLAPLLSVGTG